MDLAQVADELYGLVPAEFRVARDEWVAQARAAGDGKLAAAIAKLRRPTVSAWLVNQLAREAGDELARLVELGEALREAQRALAGETLRELSRHRRSQINALIQHAKRLARAAGQSVTAQVERDVAASLEAAVADSDAADAIQSGRLTSALYHVGLGGEDPDLGAGLGVGAAPGSAGSAWAAPATAGDTPARRLRAVPDPAAQPGRARSARAEQSRVRDSGGGARRARAGEQERGQASRPAPGRRQASEVTAAERAAHEAAAAAQQAAREAAAAERRARELAAAQTALREAEVLAGEAASALDEAERLVASARARRKSLQSQLEQLEQRLVAVQSDDARAARELREAQRNREAATGSLSTAQRRVVRAKARLEKQG